MRNLKLLLLLLCFSGNAALCQVNQIKIVSFQVKNILPAKIDECNLMPGSLVLTAQKAPNVLLREPKMVVQVKSNGTVICGNSANSFQPVNPFDVKTFTTADITGMLLNCPVLKEGNYQLCVQFFNRDHIAISNEVCKDFSVESPKGDDYIPPSLITPENHKTISKKDLLKPIQFRWSALVPKPKEPVTYHLKVWQVMKGQNGTTAIKSNTPIAEKEVAGLTQATFTNLFAGNCTPPNSCDFLWQVQAFTREGKPIGNNAGKSAIWTFSLLDDNINIKIDSVDMTCCINGKQNAFVKIRNLHATNQAQIIAIKYRVNGTGPVTLLSPTVPLLPFTIGPNGMQVFTGSINCVDTMKTVKFIVEAIWPNDPDNINNETAWDTLHCFCETCDANHFVLNAPAPAQIDFTNNILSYSQPITIVTTPPKIIKSITADLVYFEMVPENDFCIPCNKDALTYGHFGNGTNTMQWLGPQQNLNFSISTPQLTPCCSAIFKWCIRYKIEFTDCTSCNKLVCYQKTKEGCVNPFQNNQK